MPCIAKKNKKKRNFDKISLKENCNSPSLLYEIKKLKKNNKKLKEEINKTKQKHKKELNSLFNDNLDLLGEIAHNKPDSSIKKKKELFQNIEKREKQIKEKEKEVNSKVDQVNNFFQNFLDLKKKNDKKNSEIEERNRVNYLWLIKQKDLFEKSQHELKKHHEEVIDCVKNEFRKFLTYSDNLVKGIVDTYQFACPFLVSKIKKNYEELKEICFEKMTKKDELNITPSLLWCFPILSPEDFSIFNIPDIAAESEFEKLI